MTFSANRSKFNPVRGNGHEQLVVSSNEVAQRITDADRHNELKWLRNERNKFERDIEVKHDFLLTHAHRQVDPSQQQEHNLALHQIYTELHNMYIQLEKFNQLLHDKELQITGRKV